MPARFTTPVTASTPTGPGRSVRSGSRLATTMMAATTIAAVLSGLVQAGGGQTLLGRAARGDAVAAVALAMAREMLATTVEAPAPTPVDTTRLRPARPAIAPAHVPAGERHRLGPHRLDLPPPTA